MKLFFFLAIVFLCFAAYVAVRESAKQRTTQESVKTAQKQENIEYRIVRDTVYFDRSRERDMTAHEYQLELEIDSIFIYDGQRLVKVIHADSSINEVLINDNL